MDKLIKFSRDGKDSYCFIQVKDILFPAVPKSTVKSWLRELKINCKRCTVEEHFFFKNAMPHLNGAFGTIDTSDLEKLLELSQYKKVAQKDDIAKSPGQLPSDTETGGRTYVGNDSELDNLLLYSTSPSYSFAGKVGNTADTLVSVAGGSLSTTSLIDLTSSAGVVGNSDNSNNNNNNTNTLTSSECVTATATTSSTTTDSLDNAENASISKLNNERTCRIPRKCYTLPQEDISVELELELREFKEFYTSAINPSRACCKFTDSTMSKINERLLCFLGFVKTYNPSERLTLNLANNFKLLNEYVGYLTKARKLMASTVSRSLSALITVIKYTRRHVPDIEKLPEVIAIRNMQRQLGREEELTRKRKREGFSKGKNETLLFSHILDVIRQVRDQYYTTSGIASSRHLHDFVLLSLYIRVLPGRGKELRTLQLIDNTESEQSFPTDNVEELNALVFEPDGSVILLETDFKTVKTMGPSKMDLTDDEWLVYFIKIYVEKHRTTLLLGKSHNYFYMSRNGEPFLSSGAISKYLSDLFDREAGIRAATTKMRHAICTYFMSLPDSQNLKLRESLASLLKHSVRHQQETYNDQQRHEKVQLGRSFMRKRLLHSDMFEEEENELRAVKASKSPVDSEDSNDEELLAEIGELVALLDPVSTAPDNALIFIAKVLRYNPDKSRVYLQELEAVNDSSDLYRAKCNSTWWEKVETLCYPIDMVYVSSEKAYQLRTTAQQIYNDIMSNR